LDITRPENVKKAIVRAREFKNIRLVSESNTVSPWPEIGVPEPESRI
jgi:hypothetical protein